MNPYEIAIMLRRQVVVVGIVLMAGAAFAYHLHKANPGFADTATVAFAGPAVSAGLPPYAQSLIAVDGIVTDSVMSEGGRAEVRDAGGSAQYEVAIVNDYNEEYPSFLNPYATVTATSSDPAAAEKTFNAVMTVMANDLASMQAQQGTKADALIHLRDIAAPTGPLSQHGSKVRVYAALLVLTCLIAFMAARYFDRWRVSGARLRSTGPARRTHS
jgi:hypothetical protein